MARYSAQEVFSIYSTNQLTQEQIAIVETAALDAPSLVIAGAGSGKTELMMVRAMFLVANGYARPDQILGLTFTKKAANELRGRINLGLVKLRDSALWPAELGDDFAPAKISTYNSFGNEIFRSHALQIGFESDSTLLTEALAVSLVKEMIESSSNELLAEYEENLDNLAKKVLQATSQLTDHQADSKEVSQYFLDFSNHLKHLPKNDSGKTGLFTYTEDFLDKASQARLIFELAGEFQKFKQDRNLFDYSDQVALSLRVEHFDSELIPFRFVMLDEYQDTSEVQVKLLSKLFGQKSVMAVGDPNQSIYAWRGASIRNLRNFFEDFGSGQSFTLSASWRSGEAILAAANHTAKNIDNGNLAPLTLSAGKKIDSKVFARSFPDGVGESEGVAKWIAQRIAPDKTAAILFRTKDSMRIYADQLEKLGLSYEITGLSGLLDQPEVIDLMAILRMLAKPESSVDFLRIITGPKFRLAASDIAELGQTRRKLSRIWKLPNNRPLTLLETVDKLQLPSVKEHISLSALSAQRLEEFASVVRGLRAQSSLSLTELAWRVVEDFEIDIELYAHSDLEDPLSSLRSFISRISEFETSSERPNLLSLISWLDYAIKSENFELPKTGAKKGVVQLMTIHAAKGLEWDFVAVPQLSEGIFPGGVRAEQRGWLAGGILPGEFRLDRQAIPVLSWQGSTTQYEFNQRVENFKELHKKHTRVQERRLAYVAFTRAAKELYVSSSHYYDRFEKAVEYSEYFTELVDGLAEVIELAEKPSTKPTYGVQRRSWPSDPLSNTRAAWEQAANQVASCEPEELSAEILLLLKEQNMRSFPPKPKLPLRLSASAIVRLLTDPSEFARALARPMPAVYSDVAELGTLFHANLEQAFLSGSELDYSNWSEEEKKLGVNFENSRFAALSPFLVEESIEFALGGSIVVCKLDAVYLIDGEYQVVDWKSGKMPAGKELSDKAIQLSLYRIALSRKLGVPLERIRASFFYAASGEELEPQLIGEASLAQKLELLRKAHQSLGA